MTRGIEFQAVQAVSESRATTQNKRREGGFHEIGFADYQVDDRCGAIAIELRQRHRNGPLPTSIATSAKTFSAANMGDATGILNSATLVAPNPAAARAVTFKTAAGKSFASHAVLARQARQAAAEKKEE
jgi:hypothetical protein